MYECKFCDGKDKEVGNYEIILSKNPSMWKIEAYARNNCVEIQVYYCPMCGRELKGE